MPVLVVDKPPGITSFDVLRQFRAVLGGKRKGVGRLRLGHGGTLDPLATGVLPILVGEATKISGFFLDADKEYLATAKLGTATDTEDSTGASIAQSPVPFLVETDLQRLFARFHGRISQLPPMYSALKRDGKPLYEYARAGIDVPREPRSIEIHEIELAEFQPPDQFSFRVRCSKGTYIRTLVADLGLALGTHAHMTALRRVAAGAFRIDESVSLERFVEAMRHGEKLPWISLSDALAHLPSRVLSALQADTLELGQAILGAEIALEPIQEYRLLRPDGTLLAVADLGPEGRVHTRRVFVADEQPAGLT